MGGALIVGTAGHVDHGKSALVTALTGVAMDRLAEERRRGITIDLNFAQLQLADGQIAGVIDVPGHEDFVRTMVAGASGMDLALLVIAADEGIMPQTLEHLAVLEHLRVPAGIPVLTKSDLATPEGLEPLSDSVRRRLAVSPVAFERPIEVSVRSGHGLGDLRAILEAQARHRRQRASDDLFRLPVDRAFSVAGVGTVVTGTSRSGAVGVGDSVVVLPAGLRGRVRSIESHGRPLQRSVPGTRTAVGLAGVGRAAVGRGAVLVADGVPWPVTAALDVALTLQSDAPRAVAPRTRVRLLLGTAEVMARVLPRSPLEPGGTVLARLALEQPVVARGGDRFVIRSFSPVWTIGGGEVLDPAPPRRALWPSGLSDPNPAVRLRSLIDRRPGGISEQGVPLLLGTSPRESSRLLNEGGHARPTEGRWVARAVVSDVSDRALAALMKYHADQPGSPGMPLETLRRALRVPESVANVALGDLQSIQRIQVSAGVASLAEHRVTVKGGEAEIERVVRLLDEADLSPPSVGELATHGGQGDLTALLRLASERGLVQAVERDRYYSTRALDRFAAAVVEAGRAGVISPAMLRDRLGVSRKYLIPLLEWADRQRITVRVPDGRRLVR